MIEYCPDCHLAKIILRKGAGEHVLHCDASLKDLSYPGFEHKNSNASYCQLAVAFFLYIL
jgi:hypothetical protein